MKTIYVKYYDPNEVMDITPETTDQEIKQWCFRAYYFDNEAEALNVYANTMCTWSTLLDDVADPSERVEIVQEFIDEAYKHIKLHDYDWLEKNFT